MNATDGEETVEAGAVTLNVAPTTAPFEIVFVNGDQVQLTSESQFTELLNSGEFRVTTNTNILFPNGWLIRHPLFKFNNHTTPVICLFPNRKVLVSEDGTMVGVDSGNLIRYWDPETQQLGVALEIAQDFGVLPPSELHSYIMEAPLVVNSNLTQEPAVQFPINSNNSNDTQLIQVPNVEEPPKGPRYILGHIALCTNCGLSSEDLHECLRCKLKFTAESKIMNVEPLHPEKGHTNNEQSTPSRAGARDNCMQQDSVIMKKNGVRKPKMLVSTPRKTRGGGRKAEECIVLSSDDEDGPKSKIKKLNAISDVSSSNSPAKSIRAAGNKIKINLTPPQLDPPSCGSESLQGNFTKTNENETEHEEVTRSIENALSSPSLHGAYARVECRSVRIGDYKCAENQPGLNNVNYIVVFSTKGILFSVPHAQRKHFVKCVIPHDSIIGITTHLTQRLPVVILATGPKFATWIRKQLGLGDNSCAGNYYCPVNGGKCQQRIIFFATEVTDMDIAAMRQIYGTHLEEVDWWRINTILMELTPPAPNSTLTSPSSSNQSNVVTSTSDNPPLSTTSSSTTKIVMTDNHVLQPGCESSQQEQIPEASQVDMTENKTLLSYKGIAILQQDILCLADEQFLNDSILDFWLRYVEHEFLQPVDRERTYMFSTFFYKRLTTRPRKRYGAFEDDPNLTPAEKRHNRVKRWTKNVDLFEKDFIVIPINENCHWFLAVICFPGLQGVHDLETGKPIPNYAAKRRKAGKLKPKNANNPATVGSAESCDTNGELRGQEATADNVPLSEVNTSDTKPVQPSETQRIKQPCILILDSLAGEPRNRIYSTLREYLKMEYKSRKGEDRDFSKSTMPGGMPKVVQQPNHCDCGLFTLFYVECFFKFPFVSFEFPIEGVHIWTKIKTWDTKREEIYKCIQELVKKDNPEAVVSIPRLIFIKKETKKERKKQVASAPVAKLVKVEPTEEPMDVNVDTLPSDTQLTSDSGICSQNLMASPLKQSIVEMTRASPSDSDHDHDYARIPDPK